MNSFLRSLPLFRLQFWKLAMLVAIAAGLCISIGSCLSSPPPPLLRVATNLWPGNETFYLARSLGYYDKSPIRLVDYPSGTEEVRAYRNGDVEAAAISMERALALASTASDFRIILIVDTSHGGDAILGQPEVRDLKSLKNKRIGVESTAIGAFVLSRALEKEGIAPKDIEIVSLQTHEQQRAFEKKKVDAVVTYEPVRLNLLAKGANILFDSRQIPGEIVDILIARNSAILGREKVLQTLLDGYFHALNYLKQNPQDAARRIAPRTQVSPQQFLESLKGMRQPDLSENQGFLSQQDPSLLEGARRLAQMMVQQKFLDRALDPAPLFEARFVTKALKKTAKN